MLLLADNLGYKLMLGA